MIRAIQFLACLLLATGCASKRHQVDVAGYSSGPSILDRLLVDGDAAQRRRAAEQDLPSDEWRAHPRSGRYNGTRSQRAGALATELLAPVPERLRRISPPQLVGSLKTSMYGDERYFSDVAYYVYLIGNRMIMDELLARPRSEVEVLASLRNDRRSIYTGSSGGEWTIGEFVTYDLLEINTDGQPDGPANGRQPARRVAMRTRPAAGTRR
jgi:hypothetical protein